VKKQVEHIERLCKRCYVVVPFAKHGSSYSPLKHACPHGKVCRRDEESTYPISSKHVRSECPKCVSEITEALNDNRKLK